MGKGVPAAFGRILHTRTAKCVHIHRGIDFFRCDERLGRDVRGRAARVEGKRATNIIILDARQAKVRHLRQQGER